MDIVQQHSALDMCLLSGILAWTEGHQTWKGGNGNEVLFSENKQRTEMFSPTLFLFDVDTL
jgi:hypothetical protein